MLVLVSIVRSPSVALSLDWKPPANPDPRAILTEARADAAAGRNKDALAKYVWFHHNAVKLRRSLYGVRNSYAVAEWYELGKKYPPALAKLRETRDSAARNVRRGVNEKEAFDDVCAIDAALGDDDHTYELFRHLDSKKPQVAKLAYRSAREVLIKKKDYKLCGKYLDAKEAATRLTELIQTVLRVFKSDLPAEAKSDTKKVLIRECATDVALLVINDRRAEAENLAKSIKKEWDDREFHSAIEKASRGNCRNFEPSRGDRATVALPD